MFPNDSIYEVLDRGFVRLVDYMGTDDYIATVARVSTGSKRKSRSANERLIRYLIRNGHESPFEFAVFHFHVKAPLFVARQWFRHRIASYIEKSGRYVVMNDDFYIPSIWRSPDPNNKQGSVLMKVSEKNVDNLKAMIAELYNKAIDVYDKLLKSEVARELARIVLPVGLYTEFYWGVNARSLFNFFKLRMDPHAQLEIRFYAYAIWKIFQSKMPITSKALLDYGYVKTEWFEELDSYEEIRQIDYDDWVRRYTNEEN